jgi:NADH-quinone oxidoreductase subunit E
MVRTISTVSTVNMNESSVQNDIQSNQSPNVDDIIERYPDAHRDKLIPILQEAQEKFGFLSKDMVLKIGKHLSLPVSKIYGVATFYNQFRFQPVGKYHILVCRGTACHVKGSFAVLKALQRELGIEAGQTTRDGLFSLEVVACIGACGLAPVINVNGEFHGNLSVEKVTKILNQYRRKEKKDEKDN